VSIDPLRSGMAGVRSDLILSPPLAASAQDAGIDA
jgi:hypothetical protein